MLILSRGHVHLQPCSRMGPKFIPGQDIGDTDCLTQDTPGKPVTGVQCMPDLTLPVVIVCNQARSP